MPYPQGSAPPDSDGTGIPYLRPDQRSGHDLNIDIALQAGVEIEEMRSSHPIVTTRPTADSATVRLARNTMIPNRDFELAFRVAGENVKSNLLTYWDTNTNEGYFTMMLYPPASHTSLARQPMEMVFVLDCSGSMQGRPLEQAKDAVTAALDQLVEGDTFQIIRFSDNSSQFGSTPAAATRDNIRKARSYLANLRSNGGTEMIEGVKAALDFPHDPSRLRFVTFMTDGYIGNEQQILGEVHKRIGDARIFSFGVGSSVNRYLLERMAKEGRGAVAYLGPQDSADKLMSDFFNRISHPALTDVRIDWAGMAATDVYPSKIPDMFVGRAIVVTGKYAGTPGGVSISGRTGSQVRKLDVANDADDHSMPLIAQLWARLRIAELVDRQAWQDDPAGELSDAIRTTALQFQLVSDYTSFVAVDTSQPTSGDHGVTVPQAVPVPAGVRYDTTVQQH